MRPRGDHGMTRLDRQAGAGEPDLPAFARQGRDLALDQSRARRLRPFGQKAHDRAGIGQEKGAAKEGRAACLHGQGGLKGGKVLRGQQFNTCAKRAAKGHVAGGGAVLGVGPVPVEAAPILKEGIGPDLRRQCCPARCGVGEKRGQSRRIRPRGPR